MQILYLDIIDFGYLNLQHNVLPRAKHFTSDLITTMIQSDLHEDMKDLSGSSFGRIQVSLFQFQNGCIIATKQLYIRCQHSTLTYYSMI